MWPISIASASGSVAVCGTVGEGTMFDGGGDTCPATAGIAPGALIRPSDWPPVPPWRVSALRVRPRSLLKPLVASDFGAGSSSSTEWYSRPW